MTVIPTVHIFRHGEAIHNVEHGYPDRDPPLTEAGENATKAIRPGISPDLILISPMTRAIQTAMNLFPDIEKPGACTIPVHIWPDLREAYDRICNTGLSRSEMQSKFQQFDFSECSERWDYIPNTIEGATARAERVRRRLRDLSTAYRKIAVITHRGFIAYLVKGRRFSLCEMRSYRFVKDDEGQKKEMRMGLHCETLLEQDFGPTVLVLCKNDQSCKTSEDLQ